MTRKEKIKSIIENKNEMIAIKKLAMKFSDSFNVVPKIYKHESANKSELPQDTEDKIYRTIIANTYNYMDSHDDVHVKGVFTKTIRETKKLFLLHDHKFETTAQTGNIIKSYEHDGAWKDFGLDISGSTTALLQDVEIVKSFNPSVFDKYKNGDIDQHSVGMMYEKIALAVDDITDKDGYALYTSILPTLGNADKAAEQGYFFVVSEARLRETSCVLMASNDLTGIYNSNKQVENIDEMQKMFDEIFKNVENKELIYNICNKFVDTFKASSRENHSLVDKKPSFFELIGK